MSTNTSRSQESTGSVTGPHDGRNSDGDFDHRYWRCERCGLETTDPRLCEGCFRCGEARRASDSERCNREQSELSDSDGEAREVEDA